MSHVNWSELSTQVAATILTPLLDDVEADERIWLPADSPRLVARLSSGERAVLGVAYHLWEIGRAIAHVDAELRDEIEALIFQALRDTPETV